MSTKARLKLLTKISQMADVATNPDETMPTSAPVTTVSVPPPPGFTASQIWGWMPSMYNPNTISTVNSLISLLNTALHFASNGQLNWQELRNDNFQIDPSGIPSVDAKNLLNLSIVVFHTFVNSGNQPPQKPNPQLIAKWCNQITNSQAFLNLSQLNPTGAVAQKIPGGLKDTILNYTRYLLMYNPVQQ